MTHFEQAAGIPDAAEILRSIGDAAYEWRLDTDVLTWSGNAAAVLGIPNIDELSTGATFARRVDAGGGKSRVDAIRQSTQRDTGDGVAYQVQYAFKRGIEERTWVEDTGRWFAGPDGKPLRAHGTIRVIDARHARERVLAAS